MRVVDLGRLPKDWDWYQMGTLSKCGWPWNPQKRVYVFSNCKFERVMERKKEWTSSKYVWYLPNKRCNIEKYIHTDIYIHIHTFLHDMFPAWKNGVAMSQDRNLPSLSITRSAPWSWVWTPRRSARLYSNRSSAKKDHQLAEGEKQLVNVSKLGSGNKQIADPPNNKNCAFFFLGVWLKLGRIHIIIFTNIYCK